MKGTLSSGDFIALCRAGCVTGGSSLWVFLAGRLTGGSGSGDFIVLFWSLCPCRKRQGWVTGTLTRLSIATMLETAMQFPPKGTARLSHHELASVFNGTSALHQLFQGVLVRAQQSHRVSGTRDHTPHRVERQFAEGIDLIRVGQTQQLIATLTVGFRQHALQKGTLSRKTFTHD